MVPDICLWVWLHAMENYRPCCVTRSGHIQSMLPCSFLAKPEFFSLPFAKASITMLGIFLGTFHDRCRRFGSHSFERFFFCLQTIICGPRSWKHERELQGGGFAAPSLEKFAKLYLRSPHLVTGAGYSEADVSARRFGQVRVTPKPTFRPAAMVPAHLPMGFALCNGEIPALLRCLLRSHTKYAPLFAPCKTRISLIALCKNE